ncbi:MAG: hypothetical protein RLZZ196_1416 [Bacteroidota bacterium]|jgi:hypothetical protein
MLKLRIKSFLFGFDYAVKHFDKIEDHHFHSYPGAAWHDKYTNNIYRKGIVFGRKYMQYRYEVLTLFILLTTMFIFAVTW